MSRPDEGLIHAWLDGELDATEAARVERLVAEDAAWAAAAAEARGVIAASSRILRALDEVPGDVIPRGGSAAPAFDVPAPPKVPPVRTAMQRVVPSWIRMAAVFAFVAGVGYLGRTRETVGTPVATRDTAAITAPAAAPAVAATEATPVAPSARAPVATADANRVAAPQRRSESEETVVAERRAAAPVPTAAPAPAPPPPTLGVAGGVAGGVARAMREATPERAIDAPNAITMVRPQAALAKQSGLGRLDGCWRIAGGVAADPVQRGLRILDVRADTLTLALTPEATARVVRAGADTVRGTATDAGGRTVPFMAIRTGCPAGP